MAGLERLVGRDCREGGGLSREKRDSSVGEREGSLHGEERIASLFCEAGLALADRSLARRSKLLIEGMRNEGTRPTTATTSTKSHGTDLFIEAFSLVFLR